MDMKTYVFLTRRIHGVDGNIQYIYNKAKFLEARGFQTFVSSAENGPIVVDAMRRYENGILPAMFFCPSTFRPRMRDSVLETFLSRLPASSGFILESNTPVGAVWGEWAASRLGCKHVVFNLHERYDYSEDMRAFFRFKLARRELFGITENSVPLMLGGTSGETSPETRISAICANTVDDVPDRISPALDPHADYTIGSIGRLEKACVPRILDGMARFAAAMPEKSFNIVLVGGCRGRKKERKIRRFFDGLRNVRLLMTGNMYPIPESLLRHVDAFVSTAGAANATYKNGIPTIKVHPLTGEVVEIPGLDNQIGGRALYSAAGNLTIPGSLRHLLLDRPPIRYPDSGKAEVQRIMDAEFGRQLELAMANTGKDYYPDVELMRIGTPFLRHPRAVRGLVRLFGVRTVKKLAGLVRG